MSPCGTLFPSIQDPVLARFSANGSGRDSRDVVDMEVTRNNYPTAPAGCGGHAVVVTVGFHTDRKREEAAMDWGGDGTRWDICDEFETVDGMPVYYGGDLCDSDDSEDSEWEDPWNRAYAEHVDRYNFDALDGMELKVYERLWAGDITESARIRNTKKSMLYKRPTEKHIL